MKDTTLSLRDIPVLTSDNVNHDDIMDVEIIKPKGSDKECVRIMWSDGNRTTFLYNPHFDEREG